MNRTIVVSSKYLRSTKGASKQMIAFRKRGWNIVQVVGKDLMNKAGNFRFNLWINGMVLNPPFKLKLTYRNRTINVWENNEKGKLMAMYQ